MRPQSWIYQKTQELIPLTLSDFFSKPTSGIVERNLYELGEDRTLICSFLRERVIYNV